MGHVRAFARSNEVLPPIGLGTWLTFNVGDDSTQQQQRREVLQRFFAAGGGMIDSSPMYGRAEWLLGQLLPTVPHQGRLIAASKVWTPFDRWGPSQLEESLKLWGLPRFDVLLVHNLLNWRAHLKTLNVRQDLGIARQRHPAAAQRRRDVERRVVELLESRRLRQQISGLLAPSGDIRQRGTRPSRRLIGPDGGRRS